jgi:hypothetical protein
MMMMMMMMMINNTATVISTTFILIWGKRLMFENIFCPFIYIHKAASGMSLFFPNVLVTFLITPVLSVVLIPLEQNNMKT